MVCYDGAASPEGATRETGGHWTGSCVSTPPAPIRGQLRWDGNWTGNNFWCDAGFSLRSYHFDRAGSNNATWFECVGSPSSDIVASGSIPVAGKLRWDENWTGNNFWCDAGFSLVPFHYDGGGSNRANWYECHGTVTTVAAAPAGELQWDQVWSSNNFWCGAGYGLRFFHVDRSGSNNANWHACER